MDSSELKIKISQGCRIIARAGHGDFTLGHLSARLPGEQRYWIKPCDMGLDEVTPEDLILMDLDGNKIGGSADRRPHGELPIHSEIYRKRADVNCVIHTHPFYATILSAMRQPILPIRHDGCLFHGSTAYFDLTSDLLYTREQGESLAECLGDNRIVLMRNHGIVAVGPTVEEAVGTAVILERAAKTQIIAMSTGQQLIYSSTEDVRAKMVHHFKPTYWTSLWNYLNRQL